jgi:hypothetical protein
MCMDKKVDEQRKTASCFDSAFKRNDQTRKGIIQEIT